MSALPAASEFLMAERPASRDEMLALVAEMLKMRSGEVFTGFDGLEFEDHDRVCSLMVGSKHSYRNAAGKETPPTIFAAIAACMVECRWGNPSEYNTIGDVLAGLGYEEPALAWRIAHELGCNCKGELITARRAAWRVRQLKHMPPDMGV